MTGAHGTPYGRRRLPLPLVVGAAGILGLSGGAAAAPGPAECVTVRGEARYANYGYDHIVHLSNRCRVAFTCTVSTDVSPPPTEVRVPAGRSLEVLTFRGSPARAFSPRAVCR